MVYCAEHYVSIYAFILEKIYGNDTCPLFFFPRMILVLWGSTDLSDCLMSGVIALALPLHNGQIRTWCIK